MKVVWLPASTADIEEIWSFSYRTWGLVQADAYVRQLQANAGALARGTLAGRKADDVSQGLRRQTSGSHVIWFRLLPDGVQIVRVLHQSRDATRMVERE